VTYLCECWGPCRRRIELHRDAFAWMTKFGNVVTAECAEREGREVLHQHRAAGVVVVPSRTTRRLTASL
jgi:hypothetical protein